MSPEEIEELEGRIVNVKRYIAVLQEDISVAVEEVRQMKLQLAEFKVGDIVEAKRNGHDPQWRPAIVRGVDVRYSSPGYVVSFSKKDGEWGKTRVTASLVRKPEEN